MTDDEDQHREFLLAALRAATLRAKLMEANLNEIGIALKANLIGPDMAVKWLHDENLMFLLGIMPDAIGQVAKMNLSGDAHAIEG